jgi:diadenylate cyclase
VQAPPVEFMESALAMVAPGTALREGLDSVLAARTGALIVIGDSENVGGLLVDVPFEAERLFELCKMDGAIILDQDAERILRANVHLVPDPHLETSETGIRHRTAERVSLQTDALVIAISQRRGSRRCSATGCASTRCPRGSRHSSSRTWSLSTTW